MKKKDKIYDSPEYKQIREHLPEILKEMERDKCLKQYQMPEGWNEDFERIYQAEHRKERIRNRILAGACAAIILGIGAVHVGERLELTSMVQADDIGKVREDEFQQGEYQYSLYGNSESENVGMLMEDTDEIMFSANSLEQLYKEIKEETKAPFFRIEYVPDGFEIKEATYNKIHRNINYRIEWDKQYVNISQQMQVEDTGNGSINEKEKKTVYCEALEQDITIYDSSQDNALNCSLYYDKTTLSIVSNLNIEEFEKIIQKISYK